MTNALKKTEADNSSIWAGVSAVEKMIAHESVLCLKQDTSTLELSVSAPKSSGPIYAHRLGVILIVGPVLRVTLKVFFNMEDVREILSEKLSRAKENISKNNLDDYVKELLNRVAGAAKRNLSDVEISAGISLPIVTRGFDEIFSRSSRGNLEKTEVWSLQLGHTSLTFSSAVVVLNAQELSRYTFAPSVDVAADDMEFL